MILVTGATGNLGRAIVHSLVGRVPASQIGASVRDPAKAADLAKLGVSVRRGDFTQPDTLAAAFAGATQVLMVSSNAAAYGGDTLAQHRAAIDAARAAGVRRVVYTSHMAASASSHFFPGRDHAATEEMLRSSGLAWTSLRNGFYATSGLYMLGDALQTGLIEAPGDGKVSWTASADLAEAAAAILAAEGRFEGPTPPLTGPEALDFAEVGQIAGELLGKPSRREVIADEQLESKIVARGMPAQMASFFLGFYLAARAGELAAVDPTLENLIGRRPLSMRDVLASTLHRAM